MVELMNDGTSLVCHIHGIFHIFQSCFIQLRQDMVDEYGENIFMFIRMNGHRNVRLCVIFNNVFHYGKRYVKFLISYSISSIVY